MTDACGWTTRIPKSSVEMYYSTFKPRSADCCAVDPVTVESAVDHAGGLANC
jgi:hypothetical protein